MEDREFEYRFYDYDKNYILSKLKEINAEKIHDYTLYNFVVFDSKNKNKYIRLRKEKDNIYLTIKIHDSKFPIEKEIIVSNYNDTIEMMKLLGFSIKYHFEKIREKYKYKNCEIVFDMYPGLPEYMEIESTNLDDLNNFTLLLNLDYKNHKWITIPKLFDITYGIKENILNLSFENMENKILPLINKNKNIFENLIDIQKKYI